MYTYLSFPCYIDTLKAANSKKQKYSIIKQYLSSSEGIAVKVADKTFQQYNSTARKKQINIPISALPGYKQLDYRDVNSLVK